MGTRREGGRGKETRRVGRTKANLGAHLTSNHKRIDLIRPTQPHHAPGVDRWYQTVVEEEDRKSEGCRTWMEGVPS